MSSEPAEPAEPAVVVSREGGVAVLRLNEPETLNALSPAIKAGLSASVPRLTEDPAVRVLLLTGTGRAFCAGGDVRGMTDRGPVATRARMQAVHAWLQPLLTCEKPVVTALNGIAAGGGFALALAGDLIVAAETARFRASFPGLGAAPDLALAYALPRIVGLNRAKDLLLTNRELPAAEAQAIGLVARVVPAGEVMPAALALASQLAEGPAVSLGLTKLLLQRGAEMSLETFLKVEGLAQATAFATEDFAEGVAAFREKRPPRFEGR